MYCPKCRINTGKEQFCELCGCQTVDKLDEIPEKQEKSFKPNKRPSTPTMNYMKLGIVAVFIIAIFVGGSIKSMYSPDAIVERYVENVTKGKSKEAFKILDIKETDFVTAEHFDKYLEFLGIKGKEGSVRPSNEDNNFFAAYTDMQEQYTGVTGVMPRDIKFYKAQIESDIFPVVAIRKGKKFGVVDNWVIDSKGLIKEWKIQAPKGAKVYVDGQEIKNIDEVHAFGGFNTLFAPEHRNYIISSILPIDYEVTATLEGAKDIRKAASPNDPITVIGFETSEELVDELTKIAEGFIKLYYTDADISEFKDIVHEECGFLNRTSGFKTYKSRTFKNIQVLGSSIDDINHARLDVEVTFDYEQDQISNFFTGETATVNGTAGEILNLSFKKVGDKWLIVDTGYLS